MGQESTNIGNSLVRDAIEHIDKLCSPSEHCKICFAAKIFAFSFILHVQKDRFIVREFKKRAKYIADGLFLFLQQRPTSAIYVILPQIDGLVTDHLIAQGLLKTNVRGYPVWTEIASNPGSSCKNLKDAITEGSNNQFSRIGKTVQHIKYTPELLKSIVYLRNKMIHGSLTEIAEHNAVDVILLLEALHHDLELYEVTQPEKKPETVL